MPTKSPSTRPSKKKIVAARKAAPVKSAAVKKAAAPIAKTAPAVTMKAKKPARSLHLGVQLAIAGSAIAVLLLLAAVERNVFATRGSDAAAVPVTISLEHESPLSLSLLFAKKETAGYVSIRNGSTEDIHVSVPSSWMRSEVTGAEISDVKSDIPVFGFTRWSLPKGAGMKMLLPESPEAVFIDSTSNAVTAVDLKAIDLTTSQVSNKVVLVQKQSLIRLWTDAE